MKTISAQFDLFVPVPFGFIGVRMNDKVLFELSYLPAHFEIEKYLSDANKKTSKLSSLAKETKKQIQTYFKDPHFSFDLPLHHVGTDYQNKVWQKIAAIPVGEVKTYGELSQSLRSAPRAVGQACGANGFPLIIPCHRVVSSQGIGGFAHDDNEQGFLVSVKRFLLQHEKARGYTLSGDDVIKVQ